jgi:hypothetical protein
MGSTSEYAFLESDSYGAGIVPPPAGLTGNVNYFLDEGGNAITGLSATIEFSVDFVSSSNGYSFQLNGYSTEGPTITTEWQQFVLYASPNSTQLWARIDTWNGTALSDELNRIDVQLATLPSATIPAGYSFNIELTYTNDGTGTVTGANYTVTDGNGNNVGSASITIVAGPAHDGASGDFGEPRSTGGFDVQHWGGLRRQLRNAFWRRGDDYMQRGQLPERGDR